jgi:hypothetical protein
MRIKVQVFRDAQDLFAHAANERDVDMVADYVMDHSDNTQRRRLGEGCADAFAAGQAVITYPLDEFVETPC